MILLTDGSNNTGDITPELAAKAAGALGIKIYTIGIGKSGKVPYPVVQVNPYTGKRRTTVQYAESDIDMKTLDKIAALTGGESFRAQNSEELQNIYSIIDKLEKSEIKSRQYTRWRELFYGWLIGGFILLLIEFILRQTRFRRIP
jgi:Ca-activated chloride channel family protein